MFRRAPNKTSKELGGEGDTPEGREWLRTEGPTTGTVMVIELMIITLVYDHGHWIGEMSMLQMSMLECLMQKLRCYKFDAKTSMLECSMLTLRYLNLRCENSEAILRRHANVRRCKKKQSATSCMREDETCLSRLLFLSPLLEIFSFLSLSLSSPRHNSCLGHFIRRRASDSNGRHHRG